ncbi:DUF2285 domain-containing protein [Sphingomonas sp. OTU376]|uniref:DUF2285 domain-containing protein n=1 Tax=Sphingomonas sp. OTU376 TaxID=3043863 RepID=UPI00313BBF3A
MTAATPAWDARLFFDSATDPSVLACDIVGDDPEGFDLARVGCFSAVLRGDDPVEHVLLSDGLHRLRLDVRGGTVTHAPVCFRFVFDGLRKIDAPLLTLQRLVAVGRRALDAREAGASQRDVAETLFGADRVRADWAGSSDYLRSQVRRMLAFGTRMRSGGWRALLAGTG